jgi:hypothetical protein
MCITFDEEASIHSNIMAAECIVLLAVPVDFMKPLLDIIKALEVGGVIDDDNTMSTSVIA